MMTTGLVGSGDGVGGVACCRVQLALGWSPIAIARLGTGNGITGWPCKAAAKVRATAVSTAAETAEPTASRGSSGLVAMPAAAICGVKPTNVSVALRSALPVLPPAGRPPRIPETMVAVPPSQVPYADCSPIGQRAASTAAAAMSGETTCLQFGLAAGSALPEASLMDTTGNGAQ